MIVYRNLKSPTMFRYYFYYFKTKDAIKLQTLNGDKQKYFCVNVQTLYL